MRLMMVNEIVNYNLLVEMMMKLMIVVVNNALFLFDFDAVDVVVVVAVDGVNVRVLD
jgi:hypothetical protein